MIAALQLLRSPAHGLPPMFGSCAEPVELDSVHLCKHLAVPVATDELCGNFEVKQPLYRLQRQWAGKDVSADNDASTCTSRTCCNTASSAGRLA